MGEPGTGNGRAPGADEESSRERILAAARELFARNGFDATPTSHVAERAEVPKGLVHYYFNRKPDLLVALLDQLPSEHVDLSGVVVAGDLRGSLCRLVTELDAVLDSSALLSHLLWREADTHDTVAEAVQRRYHGMVDQVREVITAASPRELDPGTVDAAAGLLAHAVSYRHAVARHDSVRPEDAEGTGIHAKIAFIAHGMLCTPTSFPGDPGKSTVD